MMRVRIELFPFLLLLAACAGTRTEESILDDDAIPSSYDPHRDWSVEDWADYYERKGREIYERRDEVVAACDIQPGWTIADVGAGTGIFEALFSKAVGPQGKVFAIDIKPEFVEHIEKTAEAEGLTNVEAVLGTERSILLPENSVDLVFVCETYRHFAYPKSTTSSIYHALHSGGQLIVVDVERDRNSRSRASKALVRAEIEALGFELVEEVPLLQSSYFLRFEKP